MEKALKRARQASRMLRHRKKREDVNKARDEMYEFRNSYQRHVKGINKVIKDERINRKEDWMRGRLAPRRDVGDRADTYGALDLYNSAPERVTSEKLKWWHIVEGDRVVMVRGRDRGRIATVTDVDEGSNSVRLKGLNVADQEVPSYIAEAAQAQGKVVTREMEVPIEDVRLVFPLPDKEKGGEPRDVIIDRLEQVVKKVGEEKEIMRVVPGTNLVIPWPPTIEPDQPQYERDTPQADAESATMTHTLLFPPIPRGVIDELRNKYSKTRKRHTPEHIAKLNQWEEREQRRETLTLRTPLQELADMRRRQKEASERKLTEAQLEKIGEIMISERQAAHKKTIEAVES